MSATAPQRKWRGRVINGIDIGILITCAIFVLGAIWGALILTARMSSRYTEQTTSTNLRLSTLETAKTATEARHDRLDGAIDELTRAVYDLRADIRVNKEKARQITGGNFDNSDPPERSR